MIRGGTTSSLCTGLLLLILCLGPAGTTARAGEDADVYTELLNRYDAVNDELQKALADHEGREPLPEFHERVLSIRENAVVTIGGELRTAYAATDSSYSDPGFDPALANKGKTESLVTDLSTPAAKLLVDARLADRWRAFVDIAFSGDSGRHNRIRYTNANAPGTPLQPYEEKSDPVVIQQAYIELMKEGPTGFGFLAGIMKLPFGLWDRPNLFMQSYLDAPNLFGSGLMGQDGWSNTQVLPHAGRFIDPVVAAMVNYEIRDIIRVDAAVFQEPDRDRHEYVRDGVARTQSASSLPRSWQVGMSLQPLEGWELTAHFRNRHSTARGIGAWADTPSRWDFRQNLASGANDPRWDTALGQWSDSGDGEAFGSTQNEQAVIVGIAAEIPNTTLAVRAEYAYGWNQGFNKNISSESVNVGLSYRPLPRLTLHLQGEWLHVDDGSWLAPAAGGGWQRDARDNYLQRLLLGAEYEVAKGLTVEAGWQYERWRVHSALAGNGGSAEERINTANTFYLGTRFIF